MRSFLCCAALCILLATAALAQPGPAPAAAKPAVLFTPWQADVKVAAALQAAGFVCGTGYSPGVQGGASGVVSADMLAKFNVAVLTAYPEVGTEGPTAEQAAYIDALRQFVARGGGLILCGGNNQDTGMCVRFQNELLKPYGATVLREYVNDRPNYFVGHSFGYTWTDQIVKAPQTDGVSSLFYPMNTGWGGTSFTNPVQVDDSWTVLVRGMPTAYTCALYDTKPMEDKPATYAASPPLLAVKQAGAGRIVLWPTLATSSFIDGYHWLWDDGMVLEGTHRDRSSQGLRLCVNLVKWAAEPSVQSGALGGFVPAPPKQWLQNEPGFQAYDWDKTTVPDGLPHVYKALIGARTALSSGTGTVADYAAAAQQAGYSYLVFTEDLEKMTPTKWDQLVAQCKAANTADFLVDPGLKFFDENGNQAVVWGDIGFPKPEWMSDKIPGRIKAIWQLTHGYHYWPSLAIITPKENPKRPWFLGCCKGFAAFTYQNGKLIDEDVPEYLEMMRLRFDDFILAVHLLDSPAAVASAAQAGNMQTYLRSEGLQEIRGHLSGTYGQPSLWYFPAFVSNGPMIDTWQAVNPGTTDLAVLNNDRYRLRLAASDPAGLKEVRLYDGTRLMRRFAVTGEKYDQNFDFFHDRQRAWIADVTDQQGRRAISWQRWVEVQEQWYVNCGDNWNFMDGGKWSGTRFTDARALEAHINRASIDWTYPNIQVQQGDKTANLMPARPCVADDKLMCSRFASVVDYDINSAYEPNASANWNDWCFREGISPLTTHSVRTRCTFFTSRPDQPQIRLIEGDITFKQPVTLAAGAPLTTVTCYSNPQGLGTYDSLYLCDSTGRNLSLSRNLLDVKERTFSGGLAPGGYVSIYPAPGGMVGAFALDDQLSYRSWLTPDSANFYVQAGAAQAGKSFPAGSHLTYRELIVYGRRFADASNAEMEWIRTSLGLQGKPGYTVTPSAGQVLSSQYVLHVRAQGGGFRAKFTQTALPEDLPLEVEGLNDRWDAGLWYAGALPMWRAEWTTNEYNSLVPVMQERSLTDPVYFGPVQDGVGYFGVDTEKSDREVFAGNFLTCDQPEIFLHLLDLRPGRRSFEVHNAGDHAVATTVKPAPGFTLLGTWEKQVQVPAGSSVVVKVD